MLPKASGSARQARFKAKMESGGFRQVNLWVPADRLDEIRIVAHVLRIHPKAKLVTTIAVPGLRD